MPIVPTSPTNIKVGYIDETDGYVKDVSISAANEYEKLFPGTAFIFVDGDGKIKYLSIDEVNNLTPDDLARKEPCEAGPQPCGPPIINFVGGGYYGAVYKADNWEHIGYTAGLPEHKSSSMKWDSKEELKDKFVKPTGENKKMIFIKNI